MEEAPENGKESPHSVHANGLIDNKTSNMCNSCLRILISLLEYICIYITKFAAVSCLVEGQFVPAMENGSVSNVTARNPQSNIIKQGSTKF